MTAPGACAVRIHGCKSALIRGAGSRGRQLGLHDNSRCTVVAARFRYNARDPGAAMRLLIPFVLLLLPASAGADAVSAAAAMENPANPLALINTETGPIYIELLASEAPANVANFLSLMEPGEATLPGTIPGARGYYDGMRFHRVIPGLLIQAGSPALHEGGREFATLDDEINAVSLGLHEQAALVDNGEFNPLLGIRNKDDLDEILLRPLYRRLGIAGNAEIASRQDEILSALTEMNLQDAYAQLGYRYQNESATSALRRGIFALANRGPDDNGPEFFILLVDAPHLDGKYTVIGRVVEGMGTVDRIGTTAIDPEDLTSSGRLIYSVRRIN